MQLNNKNGIFKEIANYSGVSATDWSWGALMFDMDNDGWNDIYVCNGVNRDVTNLDFMNFFADETYHKMVLSGKKKEVDEMLKTNSKNSSSKQSLSQQRQSKIHGYWRKLGIYPAQFFKWRCLW